MINLYYLIIWYKCNNHFNKQSKPPNQILSGGLFYYELLVLFSLTFICLATMSIHSPINIIAALI